MPTALDAIVVRRERGRKRASVPAIAVLGDLYGNALPDGEARFTDINQGLQEYTRGLFQRKDPALELPTGAAFNNCNGQWTEYVYSAFAWNKLAEINEAAETDTCWLYVKLPSNRNDETNWTFLLQEQYREYIQNFDRDDEAVHDAGHSEYRLSSSNPDAMILKVRAEDMARLPLDPRTRVRDLSEATIGNINGIFEAMTGRVDPLTDIRCFISMKGSMRPDRRLQFLHEGNNVKSVLLFLIETCRHITRNTPYSIRDLRDKFYAVAFDHVSQNDKQAMDAAFIGAISSGTDTLIWAVDHLFEALCPDDAADQIGQMVQ